MKAEVKKWRRGKKGKGRKKRRRGMRKGGARKTEKEIGKDK